MKILITDKLTKETVKELREIADVETDFSISQEELLDKIKNFDAIVVRSGTKVTKEVLDASENLKAVVRAGVGLDNINLDYAKEKHVKILNTPGAPTESVAELTIGLILSLARNIPKADCSIKEGEWLKSELRGHELKDKTLGVVGLGRIGTRVAEIGHSLGMDILAHDRKPHAYFIEKVNGEQVQLDELLKRSDFVTFHVPLTPQTEGMLDSEKLSLMKSDAYLINTARGPIIDKEALRKALKKDRLAGAALDVFWDKKPFESKLMEVEDKIVFTPHLGSTTFEAQDRVGKLVVEKIKELIEKEE